MKKTFKSILSIAAVAIVALIATSCSKSQAEVNSFITSLNNYEQSIKQANSAKELLTIDSSFFSTVSEYKDSKVELTDADRDAIAKALGSLGSTTNAKMGEFNNGKAPLTEEQLQKRLNDWRTEMSKCQTLGEVVSMGIL